MLGEEVVVLKAVLGVLGISKRVEGAAVELVPLRLRIRVLGGGEASKGGIVRERSYMDIIPS